VSRPARHIRGGQCRAAPPDPRGVRPRHLWREACRGGRAVNVARLL